MKFLILSLIISSALPKVALASGSSVRGGGDPCEDRIKIIRDDLQKWILNGGPNDSQFKLPNGLSPSQYTQSMLEQIKTAQVQCVSEGDAGFPVTAFGIPKVCSFDRTNAENKITCDFKKFQSLNEEQQYVLVHHEYAGLAEIEIPNQSDSDYSVSNQLSAYLVDEVVKKLAVKGAQPTIPAEECYQSPSGNVKTTLIENVRRQNVQCVKDLLNADYFKKYEKAAVNARDAEGKTPLLIASDFGNPLRNETSDDYKVRQDKSLALGKLLIAAGANLESKDVYKDTALILASYRVPELALYLLDKGANPKAANKFGETALHQTTNLQILNSLIVHGVDVNAVDTLNGGTAMRVYTNWAVNYEAMRIKDPYLTKKPIDISEYTAAIELLLAHGADINAGKLTPLGEARRLVKIHGVLEDRLQIVQFLKSRGAK